MAKTWSKFTKSASKDCIQLGSVKMDLQNRDRDLSLEIALLHNRRHARFHGQGERERERLKDRMAQLRPTGLAKKLSEQPVNTGEGRPATGRQYL